VLPLVAEAKELIESLRHSTMDAEYLEDAKKLLALWKEESRDRKGIDLWETGM
jgi:hypothetical protein